jgi:hypothetical protein
MRDGDFRSALATDFAAIQTLGEALESTGYAFVGASGLLIMAG